MSYVAVWLILFVFLLGVCLKFDLLYCFVYYYGHRMEGRCWLEFVIVFGAPYLY